MAKKPQLFFAGLDLKSQRSFGGSLQRGHPKIARPIVTRAPMHLVLRSSHAKGKHSLLLQAQRIERVIRKQGAHFGVQIYNLANAGNHLHLIILVTNRRTYSSFIRSITGLLARIVLNSERGCAHGAPFWDARPFTRILSWGKEFRALKNYLELNRVEVSHSLKRPQAKWLIARVDEVVRKTRLLALGFS